MPTAQYRKKPVLIEAIKYDGTEANCFEVFAFLGIDHDETNPGSAHNDGIIIEAPGGPLWASVGDFIIKSADGDFYALQPEAFAAEYEAS